LKEDINMLQQEIQLKRNTARLSVISNIILVICKLFVGMLTGTVSILSEAVHSGVDLLAAAIAFMAVKKSSLPPDQDHDYGHGKVENISAAFESLLIILAAVFILSEAITKLTVPQEPQSLNLALIVMLGSSLLNVFISRRLCTVGKQTGSQALLADGMHLRTDVWTSAGVMVGILFMKITGFLWIDPLIACLVAVGIMRVGYKMCRSSYDDLTDASLSDAEEGRIGNIIMKNPEVLGFHHLRTRMAGQEVLMDFHLELDKTLSLCQAHIISEEVETALHEAYGNCDPVIHIDPK
jgi:cation diffusion facilitator family transporter